MTHSGQVRAALSSAAIVVVLGACEGEPTGVQCLTIGGASVIVEVRTQDGTPAARGATLVIRDGAFADTAGPDYGDDLQLAAGDRRSGIYDVTVSKPWYQPVLLQSVTAAGGRCGVDVPARRAVTLRLLPGAPPVRTVVAYPPAMGFGAAGLSEQLYSYVDAAAGVDTSVSWQISDSTVATLSPTGLLRSACRTITGSATITARATADPSQLAYSHVTVWRNAASC